MTFAATDPAAWAAARARWMTADELGHALGAVRANGGARCCRSLLEAQAEYEREALLALFEMHAITRACQQALKRV